MSGTGVIGDIINIAWAIKKIVTLVKNNKCQCAILANRIVALVPPLQGTFTIFVTIDYRSFAIEFDRVYSKKRFIHEGVASVKSEGITTFT